MKKIIKQFENAKRKNRLSHLYLLNSNNESELIDLVNEISNLILKDYYNYEILEQIKGKKNSQIYYIEPDGLSIKKEQIILLQDEFSKTSLVKAPRIYIIKNIDLISTSAANSLLKFMEEPKNDKVYGFLLTDNISNILPTILSRSQIVNLKTTSQKDFVKLIKDYNIEEDVAINLSFITNDKNQAKILSQDQNVLDIIKFLENTIKKWNDSQYSLTLSIYENINFIVEDKKYYKIFLELFLNYLMDVYYSYLGININLVHLEKYIKDIKRVYEVDKIKDNIYLIKEEIYKQNYYINTMLSLDLLLLRIEKSR